MKLEWQFKPTEHWNFIPEHVYYQLVRFYDDSRLRVIETTLD